MLDAGGLLNELVRYIATALLALAASWYYTARALEPHRNIEIVPLSLTPHILCTVDLPKIATLAKKLRTASLKAPPSSFQAAVRALDEQQSDVISRDFLDSGLSISERSKFLQARLVDCGSHVDPLRPDLRYKTKIEIRAVALLRSSATYAIDRDCRVTYASHSFPFRAFIAEEIEVDEKPSFMLRRSSEIKLLYIPSGGMEEVDSDAFTSFVQSIAADDKPTVLGVECPVITADKKKSAGLRHMYTFKRKRLVDAAPAGWAAWLSADSLP